MSQELSPRTQAIRKNLEDTRVHMADFREACNNIHESLETFEGGDLLAKVFQQIIDGLRQLDGNLADFTGQVHGEGEELVVITRIDNNFRRHLRRIEELLTNIQKTFSTSNFGHATHFALIETEVARIRRSHQHIEKAHWTIRAHYSDFHGTITGFLESDSQPTLAAKMLQQALQKKIEK